MKTWITDKGKCIRLHNIADPHLVNILRKLRREAQAKIASASSTVHVGTTWKDYVPVIFAALDDEAAGRGLDWESDDVDHNDGRDRTDSTRVDAGHQRAPD